MLMQDWKATQYAENARFVSELGRGVVEWLAPKPGERILDLGCGDGALTVELVQAGAEVVGVDASPDMIRAANDRGLDARLMPGESLNFNREFDAVFSNAALHWMLKPDEVLDGVARALKPGGRFVAEFGGHGNVAAIAVALRAALALIGKPCHDFTPWFYPSPQAYAERLEKHGFKVDRMILFPRPTPLPTGMERWLETFAGPFFAKCDPGDTPQVIQEATALLRPSLCDEKGNWTADYVRLRFAATLSA